jgi:hypothetical protein
MTKEEQDDYFDNPDEWLDVGCAACGTAFPVKRSKFSLLCPDHRNLPMDTDFYAFKEKWERGELAGSQTTLLEIKCSTDSCSNIVWSERLSSAQATRFIENNKQHTNRGICADCKG